MVRRKWESDTTSCVNIFFGELAVVDVCPDTLSRFSQVTYLTNNRIFNEKFHTTMRMAGQTSLVKQLRAGDLYSFSTRSVDSRTFTFLSRKWDPD